MELTPPSRPGGRGAVGIVAVASAFLLVSGCGIGNPESAPRSEHRAPAGKVIRLDGALGEVAPATTVVEQVATGFRFTEGPVWVTGDEGPHLAFSDLRGNALHRWHVDGRLLTIRRPFFRGPGVNVGPNGMTLDRDGRLVICDSGNRRIVRLERNGRAAVVVDRHDGRRLNSPNDLVYRSDGTLYFTDPPHGLSDEDRSPHKELPFNGVYRLRSDGTLDVLVSDLSRPNGIALAEDERTLYVSDTRAEIYAYDVDEDGALGRRRVFHPHSGDGVKVDRMGHVYVATADGVGIFNREGRRLGTIVIDQRPANLAWGENGSTLYITATRSLYRVRLTVVGVLPNATGGR